MFKDIRKLNYIGEAKVCKTFHQYLQKNPDYESYLWAYITYEGK